VALVVLGVVLAEAAVPQEVGDMQCSKCLDKKLKRGKVTSRNLVLDQCQSCKGIWLDKGELNLLLGSKAKSDFEIPKFALEFENIQCPKCNTGLSEFCYPGTIVLMDACKKCEGIWLDNEEWRTISQPKPQEASGVLIDKATTTEPANETPAYSYEFPHQYQSQRGAASAYTYDQSYADNIPGVKGGLLRLIDRAIQSLTSNIMSM